MEYRVRRVKELDLTVWQRIAAELRELKASETNSIGHK